MKYIAQRHHLGTAIITWALDEDYEAYHRTHYNEENEDYAFYYVDVEIYDSQSNLVHEDSIGGIAIQAGEGSYGFKEEIIKTYEYHFTNS